jgi:DNA modification methylase
MTKEKPINIEGMEQSIKARADIDARFGFSPQSVLTQIKRGRLSRQVFVYQSERKEFSTAKNHKECSRALTIGKGLWGTTKAPKGQALSIMPAELVEFFVKFYAKPGDVYLDPFMGQGVQMQVAKILGLHYYGFDLSTEFFGYIDSVRSKIDDGKTVLNITNGDSRFPSNIPDGIGDFSFHSPPYWDIENYGDEPGQLGNGSYEEFLVGMRDVARAWLPKFKPGAFHVVNVNDFRKDGRFYPYHADTIRVYKEAGWELFDTWIIAGLLISASASIFARGKIERRIAPKVHEYALVFRRRS